MNNLFHELAEKCETSEIPRLHQAFLVNLKTYKHIDRCFQLILHGRMLDRPILIGTNEDYCVSLVMVDDFSI